jgi:hypothetical protein
VAVLTAVRVSDAVTAHRTSWLSDQLSVRTQLTEEERNWHGADLDAARAACPTQLDFAQLLPEVDRLLG